jgi:hypothetical protein
MQMQVLSGVQKGDVVYTVVCTVLWFQLLWHILDAADRGTLVDAYCDNRCEGQATSSNSRAICRKPYCETAHRAEENSHIWASYFVEDQQTQ